MSAAAANGFSIAELKIIAAVALFVEALAGCYFPFLFKKLETYQWWLSLLNCFSGGVFLTAGLVHLLPHCQEAQHGISGLEADSPLYLVFVVLGYMLVFFVERVLFDVHGEAHSHCQHTNIFSYSEYYATLSHEHLTSDGCDHMHGHGASEEQQAVVARPLVGVGTKSGHLASCSCEDEAAAAGGASPRASWPLAQPLLSSHGHGGSQTHTIHPNFSYKHCTALLLAMVVHTALECMALGLMSDRRSFYLLLTAIASHKFISALALSSRFLKEGATFTQVTLTVGPFCLVAPLGVALGMTAGGVDPWLTYMLSCAATGTFLYVGASEVIMEEFEGDIRCGRRDLSEAAARYIKFLVVMAAVGMVSLQSMMHEHEHEGPGGEGLHQHGLAHEHAHHGHHHHH